jgi:hypothetical protein
MKILMIFVLIISSYFLVGAVNLRNENAVSIAEVVASAESTSQIGYVYYNFYANQGCGGSVTYQSGVAVNVCLSSDYYGVPNNNSYIPNFESFKITGLTGTALLLSVFGEFFLFKIILGDCSSLMAYYYNDTTCTHVLRDEELPEFAECRPTSNLNIQQLKSAQGYCTVGTTLPIASTSYVLSQYQPNLYVTENDASHCNGSYPMAFNAYPLELCYGTSNYTSTMYTYNSQEVGVNMNQYYDSNVCQNSSVYGEQTLVIESGCSEKNNFTMQYGRNFPFFHSFYLDILLIFFSHFLKKKKQDIHRTLCLSSSTSIAPVMLSPQE